MTGIVSPSSDARSISPQLSAAEIPVYDTIRWTSLATHPRKCFHIPLGRLAAADFLEPVVSVPPPRDMARKSSTFVFRISTLIIGIGGMNK